MLCSSSSSADDDDEEEADVDDDGEDALHIPSSSASFSSSCRRSAQRDPGDHGITSLLLGSPCFAFVVAHLRSLHDRDSTMPKEKSSSSQSPFPENDRFHPYSPLPNRGKGHGDGEPEWEDATCPICMDFPHNAVLLLCSSYDKGCRPYICNTGSLHSNCLNQYQKGHLGAPKESEPPPVDGGVGTRDGINLTVEAVNVTFVTVSPDTGVTITSHNVSSLAEYDLGDESGDLASSTDITRQGRREPASAVDDRGDPIIHQTPDPEAHSENGVLVDDDECMDELSNVEWRKELKCPLCRGGVNGWTVVPAARKHLNHKARNCSEETCTFHGTYEELHKHAKLKHPNARPSAVDPSRLRDWRRLEHQRNVGDVLSSIRAAMPGATIVGDHVIETSSENENDTENGSGNTLLSVPAFLFLHLFAPPPTSGGRVLLPGRWGLGWHQSAGRSRARQSWDSAADSVSNETDDSSADGSSEDQMTGMPQNQQPSED